MPKLNVVDFREPRLVLEADSKPLIPEGRYELAYVRHEYRNMFKGATKLIISFRVVNQGQQHGLILEKYYNVRKSGKGYRSPRSGDLARDMTTLFGKRQDRQTMDWGSLRSVIVIGEVETVSSDSRQRHLSKETKYSKVGRLTGLAD